jgi:hypothetical protein
MERPRPGDVPPATATRTINIVIQHDLWILRSRSIVKAYSVLAGRSGSCDREDLPQAATTLSLPLAEKPAYYVLHPMPQPGNNEFSRAGSRNYATLARDTRMLLARYPHAQISCPD